MMLLALYIVLCFVLFSITIAFGSVAELAYDKKSHNKCSRARSNTKDSIGACGTHL